MDDNIKNREMTCSKEYGNPSGHSIMSSVLGLSVALEKGGLVIAMIYACIIGWSRVVLGVHSAN